MRALLVVLVLSLTGCARGPGAELTPFDAAITGGDPATSGGNDPSGTNNGGMNAGENGGNSGASTGGGNVEQGATGMGSTGSGGASTGSTGTTGGGTSGANTGASNGSTANTTGGTSGGTTGTSTGSGTTGGACTTCGASCVDTQTDTNHCGGCNIVCPSGGTCTSGRCEKNGCIWSNYGDHKYFVCASFNAGASWEAARAICRNLGLDLAIINDAAEQNFLATLPNSISVDAFFGLSDLGAEGVWRFVDPATGTREGTQIWQGTAAPALGNGAEVGGDPYTSWAGTEPSLNTDSEDCATLLNSSSWYDNSCTQARAFMCESY